MIEQYAARFGLDPDYVFKNSRFDTVTVFLLKWKEKGEFDDRYMEWEKLLNSTPK